MDILFGNPMGLEYDDLDDPGASSWLFRQDLDYEITPGRNIVQRAQDVQELFSDVQMLAMRLIQHADNLSDTRGITIDDQEKIQKWVTEHHCLADDPKTVNNDCQICLSPLIKTRLKVPDCGHIFHRDCLRDWLEKSINKDCPVCRAKII